jgi:HAD superfamily hydrolase (TIGR01509 family)
MRLPRAPAGVVFDLDGLIIDSERLVHAAMVAVSPRFGRAIDLPFFLTLVGCSREENDARMRDHFGADFPLDAYYEAIAAYMRAESEAVAALKAGVLELLDALDARALPRAIATSSRHEWVDRQLGAHGLIHRFDVVIARGDYAQGKPHPEPYLKAAAALGVAPALCLALEDSHHGVRAAHAAGMMTVMAPDLLAPTDEMREKTVLIVETLHDVAALIRDGCSSSDT